ncbi:hypothetical protein PMAYCL1PPCAC_20702, partial [Pristionchus mayeri]
LSDLSTELVEEKQKYLELDEKYQDALQADRIETPEGLILHFDKNQSNIDNVNETSELKQRVSILTTQLERERQKIRKLEDEIQRSGRATKGTEKPRVRSMLDIIRDHDKNQSNSDKSKEIGELKHQVSTLRTQLEREREKNRKLEENQNSVKAGKLRPVSMLDIIRDRDQNPSNIDNSKDMNDLRQRVNTMTNQLERERQKNLKLEDKILRHVRSTSGAVQPRGVCVEDVSKSREEEQENSMKMREIEQIVADVKNELKEERRKAKETIDELTSKVAEYETTSLHSQQIRIEELKLQVEHYETLFMQTLQISALKNSNKEQEMCRENDINVAKLYDLNTVVDSDSSKNEPRGEEKTRDVEKDSRKGWDDEREKELGRAKDRIDELTSRIEYYEMLLQQSLQISRFSGAEFGLEEKDDKAGVECHEGLIEKISAIVNNSKIMNELEQRLIDVAS